MKTITILGGSGFVGSSLVAKLDQAGYRVKVLTRNREKAKQLILLPHVTVVECDLSQASQLREQLKGSDAVINLIGILHESKRASFEQMHHQFARRLAQQCEELAIPRLIHMSALQASANAPSAYLRSKGVGEAAVNEFNKKIAITIFRPSVIFGEHDSFMNLFAGLIKCLPVVMLAMPRAKFQPIWVEDVTSAMVNALFNTDTYGKTYELGGPEVYTLKALIEKVMMVIAIKRPIIGLNNSLSMLQAGMMELLPIKLMSRDNVRSMQVDNVCQKTIAPELGVSPASLDAILPSSLNHETPRNAYNQFRRIAGRKINARR